MIFDAPPGVSLIAVVELRGVPKDSCQLHLAREPLQSKDVLVSEYEHA